MVKSICWNQICKKMNLIITCNVKSDKTTFLSLNDDVKNWTKMWRESSDVCRGSQIGPRRPRGDGDWRPYRSRGWRKETILEGWIIGWTNRMHIIIDNWLCHIHIVLIHIILFHIISISCSHYLDEFQLFKPPFGDADPNWQAVNCSWPKPPENYSGV